MEVIEQLLGTIFTHYQAMAGLKWNVCMKLKVLSYFSKGNAEANTVSNMYGMKKNKKFGTQEKKIIDS